MAQSFEHRVVYRLDFALTRIPHRHIAFAILNDCIIVNYAICLELQYYADVQPHKICT